MNNIKLQIGKTLTKTLSFICGKISLNNITVKGIENIPTDQNFLLVSNHPSYIDSKIIDDVLDTIGLKTPFICHGDILKIPFIGNYLKSIGYVGVYNYRKIDYYLNKGNNKEEASKKAEKRKKEAKINLSSIKKSISQIINGGNLAIFISGGGYEDKIIDISKGYKIIVKNIVNKNDDVTILPVKINLISGYKKRRLIINSDVEIIFHKTIIINKNNLSELDTKISNIYK